MSEKPPPPSAPVPREQRLAAKLRENLRRRKDQARQLAHPAKPALPKEEPSS